MSFTFIQISDHHLRETDTLLSRGFSTAHSFRTVVRHLAEHHAPHADFLLTTGDLVDAGTDAEYRATFERLGLEVEAAEPPGPHRASGEGLARLPMYFLPGNHDPRPAYFRNLFPKAAPRAWNNVAFHHKGIQFVCIDWGMENKAVADPAMLTFLTEALKGDTPTVIFSHHAVVRVGVEWLDAFIADDVQFFWNIVRGHNVLGVFTGHLHATYERVVDRIPVFGVRATTFQFPLVQEKLFCLQPPHYRVVTVDDDKLSTEIVEVAL